MSISKNLHNYLNGELMILFMRCLFETLKKQSCNVFVGNSSSQQIAQPFVEQFNDIRLIKLLSAVYCNWSQQFVQCGVGNIY